MARVMLPASGDFSMTSTPRLNLHANGIARIYAWSTGDQPRIRVNCDTSHLDIDVTPVWNAQPLSRVMSNATTSLQPESGNSTGGIWMISIASPDGLPQVFQLEAIDTCLFLWPGPGIVPSHFDIPNPALSMADNDEANLWIDVPGHCDQVTLQAWLAPSTLPSVVRPDSSIETLHWHIEGSTYHVADIPVGDHPGCWRIPMANCPDRTYIAVFEGLPIFLTKPAGTFPYATMTAMVSGGLAPIASRVEVRLENQLLALRDGLPGEQLIFHLMPGSLSISASAGFTCHRQTRVRKLVPGDNPPIPFVLEPALVPEPGWYAGDHHMHSYWEDGGQSPSAVIRSARAQHLNYIFLTDVPEELLADRIADFNETNVFLAMPGEEIMNRDVHANALNTHRNTGLSGNDSNGDPLHAPAAWIDNVAAQSAEGPRASLMLNHPSHRPEVMSQRGYFRSWWVADEHPGIRLVENFDFPSWFERLNRNRPITGLWTTDMHDVVFIPPGLRRTYVYIDGDLTAENIIESLERGHCFNTRAPGALVYLTVNDAIPGETAPESGASHHVSIRCTCNRPIDRIDLVSRGEIVRSWSGSGAQSVEINESLQLSGWALAMVYAVEEEQHYNNGHLGTPLDLAGCIAFTNPVWIPDTMQEQSA